MPEARQGTDVFSEPGRFQKIECAVNAASTFGGGEYGLPPVTGVDADRQVCSAPPSIDTYARLLSDRESQIADELYREGKSSDALMHYVKAIQLTPDQPRFHFMAGLCAWQASQFDAVEPYLLEAVRLQPNHPAGQHLLADWRLGMGDIRAAVEHSRRAVAAAPLDQNIAASRACVLEADGQYDAAWEMANELAARGFMSPRLAALLARLSKAHKSQSQALSLIENLLRSEHLIGTDRKLLHFAAAALLDDARAYEEAFAHARMAHASVHCEYDPRSAALQVDRRIQFYNPRRFHNLPRASHQNRRPVFIIGMPRSGTSLIEQILASHPDVYAAGEQMSLTRIAARLADSDSTRSFPECLESISLRTANQMAEEYLAEITRLNSSARYVTDKMPANFLHLDLITVLFPDSHVIYCTRDPLDTCLSCYFTDFTHGHEFSHDLLHAGSYFEDYQRLTQHWTRTLNFPMLEVNYESVVADLEGQVRRLLEHLDLPWEERCLNFHETQRRVATASREQVRRPLYRTSVGRWKHYEKHLGGLRTMLAGAGHGGARGLMHPCN